MTQEATTIDYPECEDLQGRMRAICRGEADITPEQRAAYRVHWGKDKPTDGKRSRRVTLRRAVRPDGDQPKGQPPGKRPPQPHAYGPGSELQGVFRDLGVSIPGCLGCNGTIKRMNLAGVAGCRAQKDAFVTEIKSRAKDVPAATWVKALANGAKLALTQGLIVNPLDPISGLFDIAVNRAEAKNVLPSDSRPAPGE